MHRQRADPCRRQGRFPAPGVEFDPLGRWVLPKHENASASLFLTPTMPPHQKLPWQPVPPAVRRGRPCRSRRCRTWRESEGPSRGGSLMSQSKHARVRPAAAPRRAFAILGQEELPSIVGRTHTGRTCCDNDLLKSSDPLILPSPAHWERVLTGCNWGLRS